MPRPEPEPTAWAKQYQPKPNPAGGFIWDEQAPEVRAHLDAKKAQGLQWGRYLWTVHHSDEEGPDYLKPGLGIVNRLGVILTEAPWEGEEGPEPIDYADAIREA